jgi:hypothetical protein
MEAPVVLRRSFQAALGRSRQCRCKSTSPSLSLPLRSRSLLQRSFSSSARRRQELSTQTSSTAPPPISQVATKEQVEGYISSVNKIIEGHNLQKVLRRGQYENLVSAIINAETRIGAPGAGTSSYTDALSRLRQDVEPTFKFELGTSDVTTIANDIGKFEIVPQRRPRPESTPKKQDISGLLNSLGSRTPSQRTPLPEQNSEATASQLVKNLTTFFEKDYLNLSNQNMNARLAASDGAYINAAYASKGMSSNSTASLRLKPSLGRTLEVYTGTDVTSALRKLEVTCARNRIRHDFERQRFHVRRGMKKKLMKMQRWRVVFKEGFLAECARVRKMRKQGW